MENDTLGQTPGYRELRRFIARAFFLKNMHTNNRAAHDTHLASALSFRKALLLLAGCALSSLVGFALLRMFETSTYGLPYHDSFASDKWSEWQQLGGQWEIADGQALNRSTDRGAKLLAGSSTWANYSVEADVQLAGGQGDAGLVIRGGNEELGSDSYSGYYTGIRTLDNTLVLGRADHGWIELPPVPFPSKIDPNHWYHLRFTAVGCSIGVIAQDLQSQARVASLLHDSDCVKVGHFALRSYDTAARWRHVVASVSSAADLAAIQALVKAESETAEYPNSQLVADQRLSGSSMATRTSTISIAGIDSLRYRDAWNPSPVRIRGRVVMATPSLLYVEDGNGALAVQLSTPSHFNTGDQVEAEGQVQENGIDLLLENASTRLLWSGRPVPPKSLPASEIAIGSYNDQYVEVTGLVTEAQVNKRDGQVAVSLTSGSQEFSAILSSHHDLSPLPSLHPRSLVRLRGVATSAPFYTKSTVPFVILLNSADGIELLASPPWWSIENLVWTLPILVIFLLLGQMLRVHVGHVKVRAVMSERERLAHEMHDTLAQSFAGIGYQLQAIRNGVESGSSSVPDQLALASDLVRHSHQEARRSIESLHPELMQSSQLAAALEQSARSMVRRAPLQISARTEGQARPLPPRVLDALFRTGQEAIANAVRHARPNSVEILVEYARDRICLRVIDDGKGFIVRPDGPGFGMRGMRKRMEEISGEFIIISTPGQGSTVSASASLGPTLTVGSWLSAKWK